jgi:hypothetical protein
MICTDRVAKMVKLRGSRSESRLPTLAFRYTVWLTCATALALYLFFARFDAGGEDGVYYTPAIAIRDGLIVHRDVFTQYGPVFSMFQALFMKVFTVDTVLGLRYLNSLILVAAGYLVAQTFARIYSMFSVVCALVTWFASAYFFSNGISMLAWPSVFSLLLSVMVLWLLIERTGISENIVRVSSAGILTALQIFVRANLGTTTMFGIILVLLLARYSSSKNTSYRPTIYFVLTNFFVVIGITAWLKMNNALGPFLDQSLKAPAAYYASGELRPGITNGEVPLEHMAKFGITYGLPALLVLAVGLLASMNTRLHGSQRIVHAAGSFFSIFIAWQVWNKGLATDPFKRFAPLYGLVIAALVFSPLLISQRLVSIWQDKSARLNSENSVPRLLVIGFAVASVVQLYPGDDPRHLFWVGLIPIAMVLGEISHLKTVRVKWLVPVLMAFMTITVSIGPAIDNASIKRVNVTNNIAYNGLLVAPAQKEVFDRITLSLNGIPKNGKVVILCDDAQITSWQKRFIAADRMYVTWSWQIDYPSMAKVRQATWSTSPYVAFCGTLEAATEWSVTHNYVVQDGSSPVVVLRKK